MFCNSQRGMPWETDGHSGGDLAVLQALVLFPKHVPFPIFALLFIPPPQSTTTPSLSRSHTNNAAALKCRQRKKAWLNELQTKVEQLQMENDRLNQTVAGLHDEVSRLTGILMQHRDCGLGGPGAVGMGPQGGVGMGGGMMYGRPMGR